MLPDLATRVETNYLLETSDDTPAFIAIKTTGWRTGPKDVLKKLFDPELATEVKTDDYFFQLFINLETGDERYKFLNEAMWISSGARHGSEGWFINAAIDS